MFKTIFLKSTGIMVKGSGKFLQQVNAYVNGSSVVKKVKKKKKTSSKWKPRDCCFAFKRKSNIFPSSWRYKRE